MYKYPFVGDLYININKWLIELWRKRVMEQNILLTNPCHQMFYTRTLITY